MAIRATVGEACVIVDEDRLSIVGPSGMPICPQIIRGNVYAPVERIISILGLGHATEESIKNQDPLVMSLDSGVAFEAASQRSFAMLGGVKVPLATSDNDGLKFELLHSVLYGPIKSLARILRLNYAFDEETKSFVIAR